MKRALPIIVTLGLGGSFLATLVYLYSRSQEEPEEIKTEAPTVADIVQKAVASGSIVPRQEVEIKPRVSGIIEKLHVEAGHSVKEGDLIATIQIVPNMVNLSRAEASVEAARINVDSAKRELDRGQGLFEKNILPESDYDRYKLDYALKAKELDAARDSLQLIKSGASRKSGKIANLVRSTVEGMVIEVPVKEGQSVTETNNFNSGTTIARVADMGDMIFEGRVDESEVGKVKEGMELDIVIGALENQHFKATLEHVAPKGIKWEGAMQFEIRAAIEPKDGVFIRAGYSANADVVLDKRSQVLTIDEKLLHFGKDKKPFVEVRSGSNDYSPRSVKLGLSDGIRVEVLGGVDKDAEIKVPAAKSNGKGPKGHGH